MNSTQELQKGKFEAGNITKHWEANDFSEAIDINPKRELKKGTIAKFVSMGDLKEFDKKIHGYTIRKFSGGSKFTNCDTLMARITPCLENGKTAFVDILSNEEVGSGSTEFIILSAKKDKTIPHFVYYLAISPEIRKKAIKSMTGTSGRQRVENDIFDKITILIPPIAEQEAIIAILKSLDDKIALNRSMNSTLEAIGQALFRRWFVDFEFPDEEGRPYRSSGGEMVDSELGEVPKGWRVGTLGDICEITMGQSPPGETYNEKGDGLPFYQGISDFGFRFPSRRVYCTAPTRFAEEGDILLSVRAPVGSLNIAEERCAIGRGLAALCLKGKQQGYLYYLLRATQLGWNKFEAEGTVFGSVTKADVHDFKIILPPENLRNSFYSFVKSLDKQITTNEKQARTLAALRDTLLPKLMSGDIRVFENQKLKERSTA